MTSLRIAVAILYHICQLFHILAVNDCQSFTKRSDLAQVTVDMLTTYPVLFCMFGIFCMRFANLKKFHKALCRTHQIKDRYELLCLKYLEWELTTRQPFLYLHMSSLWFFMLTLKNATNKTKNTTIILMLCDLNDLKFPCSSLFFQPSDLIWE